MEFLFFVVYLAGIPFAAGLIGPKSCKGDWVIASIMAAFSWVGAALFFAMTLAMFAAAWLYRAGFWAGKILDRLPW